MEEEDDFGFMLPGKSRLSSLFPASNVNEQDVNQSLTYVPPKQPRKNAPESTSGGGGGGPNMQLLLVVAAYAYKLESGKYSSVGKLGVAILGDKDAAVYKLLLYKGKQQQVAVCSITVDFQFVIEPNSYAKFSDDKEEQWSVMFSSEAELISFTKQIGLARANSSGKVPAKLVVQDLVAGDGRTIASGDSADLIYTGWLLKDYGFGEVFDENVKKEKQFIVKIGKTKVIKGLTEGLIGAKKGMRRLLIIPPGLAYGAEGFANLVPPNSTLIFEVFVKKVKISRDASESPSPSRKGSEAKPEVPPRTQSVSDDTIRSRGASISEQLTQSPRKDNAKLISRMAKMGLPTLPMQGAIPAAAAQTSSESEPEKEHEPEQQQQQHRKSSSPSPKPATGFVQRNIELEEEVPVQRKRNLSMPKSSSPQVQVTSMPYTPYSTAAYPVEAAPFMHQPIQTHAITPIMQPFVPNVLESHIPLLVTETRTQNTEVRLALGKISDKVDTILQKIDETRYQQSGSMSATFHGQVPYMEGTILAQNVERIVQENAQFKKDNEAKSSKIQELNEKICDILQRNQRFFEESNSILEQRSDSLQMTTAQLQSKILSLEQEKAKLSTELGEHVSKYNILEARASELQSLQENLANQLASSESKKKELEEALSSLRESLNESNTVIQGLKANLEEAKQLNEEVRQESAEKDEELKAAKRTEEILRAQMEKSLDDTKSALLEDAQVRLQAEADKVMHWKKKYETLHENARVLKDKYESQMMSMASEIKKLKAAAAVQKSIQQPQVSQDFSSEIKRAMNILYKLLRSEVNPTDTYSGADVLKISLAVIQRVTLSLIEKSQQPTEGGAASKVADEESQIKEAIPSSTKEPQRSTEEQNEMSKESQDVEVGSSVESAKAKTESSDEDFTSEDIKTIGDSPTNIREKDTEDTTSQSKFPKEETNATSSSEVPVLDKEPEIRVTQAESEEAKPSAAEAVTNVNGVPENTEGAGDVNDVHRKDEEADRKTPDIWRPQPPPLPLFDEEEDEDDWLK